MVRTMKDKNGANDADDEDDGSEGDDEDDDDEKILSNVTEENHQDEDETKNGPDGDKAR